MERFIHQLEEENELIRVKEFVDPVFEIAEITDRFAKQQGGGKALLFENNGTSFPLLINAFGSEKRICKALRVKSLNDFAQQMQDIFSSLASSGKSFSGKIQSLSLLGKISSWMPVEKNGKGLCQKVIHHHPDLSMLPILKCWPADGGRFITFPLVHTIDPLSGSRNLGMYRMQVFSNESTGMHWHKHKTGARHYEEYKRMGKRMPVSVALGGDPAYTYSATAPLPDGIDEYMLAGFIRKKKVQLVKCITNDIFVPNDADIVIEGYVDPCEPMVSEGPFGDHTGFYSLEDKYPVFHVTCITHKKNAIYPATIVGVPPQEDEWLGKATEKIFIEPIRKTVLPELHDMNMPVAGTFHNLVIISIHKSFPGHAIKSMNALWGAGQMMLNKIIIVVDSDVDINNYQSVFQACLNNVNPTCDFISNKGPLDVLDHASPTFAYGSKLGIDATAKFEEEGSEILTFNESDEVEIISFFTSRKDTIFHMGKGWFSLSSNRNIDEIEQDIKLLKCKARGIVLFDKAISPTDFFNITWLVAANTDPAKDIRFLTDETQTTVIIDGTIKVGNGKHFPRPWPNVVTSSENTIREIDARWASMSLGPFILSPSLKYRQLILQDGAVAANPK